MKLSSVFMARGALARLATLRLKPSQVAYKVLKFSRKFDSEVSIIERQRTKLIMDITGAKEGENAQIKQGTPEMKDFFEKFAPILDTDCELGLCPLKFGALLDAVDTDEGNALSAQDLALLEPLFESDEE